MQVECVVDAADPTHLERTLDALVGQTLGGWRATVVGERPGRRRSPHHQRRRPAPRRGAVRGGGSRRPARPGRRAGGGRPGRPRLRVPGRRLRLERPVRRPRALGRRRRRRAAPRRSPHAARVVAGDAAVGQLPGPLVRGAARPARRGRPAGRRGSADAAWWDLLLRLDLTPRPRSGRVPRVLHHLRPPARRPAGDAGARRRPGTTSTGQGRAGARRPPPRRACGCTWSLADLAVGHGRHPHPPQPGDALDLPAQPGQHRLPGLRRRRRRQRRAHRRQRGVVRRPSRRASTSTCGGGTSRSTTRR